jgi:hypothetical protein
VLFCSIMSRVPGRKHDALLGEKGGQGFPYIVFMDETGKVIGKPTGRTVKAFRQGARYLNLERKEKRTTDEEVEFLELGLAMGSLDPAKAKEILAKLEISDEQKAKLEKAIKTAEGVAKVKALLGQIKSRQDMQAKGPAIGKQMYALYQEGVRPQPGSRESMAMYQLMIAHGLQDKIVEPARTGLDELKKMLKGNKRAQGFLKQMEAQVKALEDGQK